MSVLKQQRDLSEEQQEIVKYLDTVAETEYVSPKIVKIEKTNSNGYFYDLSVPETESFVVNGLVVHNSAARYQRYVEELIENYYRRIGQAMDETLMASDIRKVIVGGPGPVKDNFLKMKAFNYRFQIIAVLDTGYVDDYGIQELARKAVDVIAEEKTVREKKLLEKFFLEVSKGGLATYGAHDTIKAMNSGKIDTLLLSEKLNSKHLKVKCKNGDEEEIVVDPEVDRKTLRCPLDHAVEEVLAEKDFFDEMYDKADIKEIEVETISEETNEGKQFLAGFKGIGAILKYR
jgi:peptide chain release factor subunit 1